MSMHTPIEWCDSAVNPVMGCDGCELWTPDGKVKICYAGTLHDMRGGNPGYAADFLKPEMFDGRMGAAARWGDLRGKCRELLCDDSGKVIHHAKPWLDGRPRHVFISDMGDALSKSIPLDWLRREVVGVVGGDIWRMRGHIGMWLTKQPQRAAALDADLDLDGIAWPAALWMGTSITGPGQGARVRHLRRVRAAVRFLSVEPVLTDPGELDLDGINLVIVGGESGGDGRTDLDAFRRLRDRVLAAGAKLFIKQLGSRPFGEWSGPLSPPWQNDLNGGYWRLRDRKGGDWSEWPADLRFRQFPVQS